MDLDWTRLGARLRADSRARGLEQQDVAREIGVKRGAVWNIETGKISKVTKTVRDYAQLVGWTADSPELVLQGNDPVVKTPEPSGEADDPQSTTPAPEPSDLSLSVKTALRQGPLLDSRVHRIRTPAGEVTATIVARGSDGMTYEQQLEALEAWKALGPTIVDDESGEP